MALKPQTSPMTQELLAMGYVRVGTTGELVKPDGTVGLRPAIANSAGAPTQAEFNALLATLRAAGIIAP